MQNIRQPHFFRTDLWLYVFLIIQIGLWTVTRQHKPDLAIVPPVPSPMMVKAFALGDDEFYFRVLALRLQNAGDTFGRFTALKEYDYRELYRWFTLLDTLDQKSNFVPALAGYYFSQTQNTPDVIYVVKYLDKHASRDLYHKWWWMSQAVYLANHKLKDKKLALELAYKLASTPRDDIPLWAKQMPAFIHEQMGEEQQALIIIEDILRRADHEQLDPGEINFMKYFIQDRLHTIIENHPEIKKLMDEAAAKAKQRTNSSALKDIE